MVDDTVEVTDELNIFSKSRVKVATRSDVKNLLISADSYKPE